MSFCHGKKHHGIDPNILTSGHHDCSTKTIYLCTAVELQSCHMSGRQKPLLTLETIQHLRFPVVFWTFGFFGIMGYRSGILRLEFLAFLSAIRIDKTIEKKGNRESGIAFEISHPFAGFWHLMTGDIMNQTSEVLTDAHMLAHGTQHTGPSPRSKCTAQLPCLNLVNGMFFSNSDSAVQSAGYNSAQSPTNWESTHGDPSVLCWPFSRLSIALDDNNPQCEIQDCELTCEICTNLLDSKCFSKIQGICCQHNYIFLQSLWDNAYAKQPEIWRASGDVSRKRSFV